MCLILLSKNHHPKYKLIIAANRDEFYARPTQHAHWWNGHILSGRDTKGQGTWLGINRSGRIAAITNYRDPALNDPSKASRGELSHHYLDKSPSPESFTSQLQASHTTYNPYNIIYGDMDRLFHFSNISQDQTLITSGIHGLSNHLLNSRWPKVQKGTENLKNLIENRAITTEKLFELLADTETADINTLPDTGISADMEHALSSMFIQLDGYGTRCSTTILVDTDNQVTFSERTFHDDGSQDAEYHYQFQIGG